MRWIYTDPNDIAESLTRGDVLHRIDAWWTAFADQSGDLEEAFRGRADWDVSAWMAQHLQAIAPELMWEFGPGLESEHRLVITPETHRHLRPMLERILERAPKLEGWEFYPHRLAEDAAHTLKLATARAGGDAAGALVAARPGRNRRIDLVYHLREDAARDADYAFHQAFVLSEALLGEELLDTWVGAIEVATLATPRGLRRLLPAPQAPEGLVPLDRLQPTVEALIATLVAGLPPTPMHETTPLAPEEDLRAWSSFELQPVEAEDYARQDDLLVALTPLPEMTIAAHDDPRFYSRRFSRVGETFCYVKLDGSEEIDLERFPDREAIETLINQALVTRRLGAAVGGGTGRRYSYVDLALSDVPRGLETIQETLRTAEMPRRTWLLFHDCELRDEWVGLWPQTPRPPLG